LRPEEFVSISPESLEQSIAGPWFFRLQGLIAVVYVLGLLASIDAVRRASTESARRRAHYYAWAFGARDALSAVYVLYILFIFPLVFPLEGEPLVAPGLMFDLLSSYSAPPFITLVYVPLIAYGILKSQLFDIDLKIKWAISRTAIGAAFLATFLIATNITGEFLSSQYGYLGGGAAAGILLFALTPIQKAAERVAAKAVPQATGSVEYLAFKKFEVYRAAFEGVLEDGAVNTKERAMLSNLRSKLGIAEADARALESDVLAVQRSPAAVPA
jgi:hypothetical protein